MQRRLDQWSTALTVMVLVAALLACKKRTPAGSAPSAEPVAAAATPSAAPLAPPAAAAPTNDASPKLGEVKRYADKEKTQSGAVRILENDVKVFNEADEKTAEVATLNKDLLVFRLASIPDWELVEFPSGVGKVSPGWVQAKFIDAKADAKVERDAVAAQDKQAVVKAATSASAKPAASTTSSAKAAASSTASAKAVADKAAADKAAADKAAADKAAADKAAADKAAADKAAAREKRRAERAAKAAAAAAADK